MFKIAEKNELNQISLTGMRALVLLGLLMQEPRSLEEIREAFIKLNIMDPEHSDDILRIDLNTLRAMGCNISRAGQKTNFKYVLEEHPFALNITHDEISMLKRLYKKVKDGLNIALLLKYDKLFTKLADYVAGEEIKEELLGLSVLKSFNTALIIELLEYCKNNKIIKLSYKNPIAKLPSTKEIVAEKVILHNDKLYLYGFDLSKKRSVTLNIKRIVGILSNRNNSDNLASAPTVVQFKLKNIDNIELEECENILETQNDAYIIQGRYYNDFIAYQRILSFGANCTVIEPEDFKINIIAKIRSIRSNYND